MFIKDGNIKKLYTTNNGDIYFNLEGRRLYITGEKSLFVNTNSPWCGYPAGSLPDYITLISDTCCPMFLEFLDDEHIQLYMEVEDE